MSNETIGEIKTNTMYEKEIDWSIFNGDSEATCYCCCGTVFRSHAKGVYTKGTSIVTRKPCPSCGQNDNCNRIYFDPERFILRVR